MKIRGKSKTVTYTRSGEFSIWNGWSRNYSRLDDGYITHAFDEKECREKRRCVSICGVNIEDSGLVELGESGWYPGCLKCQAVLIKRGFLKLTSP